MKKRIVVATLLLTAMITGYLLATIVNNGGESLQAEGTESVTIDIDTRLQKIERALAIQQDGEEAGKAIAIDERIIVALETLAENSKNLEEIVIRLEGIERELAWKRIDEQDAGN